MDKRVFLNTRTLTLTGLFLLILIAGRFMYAPPDKVTQQSDTARSDSLKKTQATERRDAPQPETQSSEINLNETAVASCVRSLKASTLADKTEYDRGTILVRFKDGVEFGTAKNILGLLGLTVKDEAATKDSYPAERLLTAAGAAGQEFEKICLLRQNASVRFAGLNILFSLHE